MISAERSRIMRAVKSRDTGPERQVKKLVRKLGCRYRSNFIGLPGTPDLVLPLAGRVIFVHGCFWHGHGCKRGARQPKTNAEYWIAKIARNKARDSKVKRALSRSGWKPLTVWECELADEPKALRKLQKALANVR
jgi:DNA mismatch endonuclease (patch repair protein)